MCLVIRMRKMPYTRFLVLDAISCAVWSLMLAGVGYFFSGAITALSAISSKSALVCFLSFSSASLFFMWSNVTGFRKRSRTPTGNNSQNRRKTARIENSAENYTTSGERLHLTSRRIRKKGEEEKRRRGEKLPSADRICRVEATDH